jgi:hypothetical protein
MFNKKNNNFEGITQRSIVKCISDIESIPSLCLSIPISHMLGVQFLISMLQSEDR